MPLPRLPRYLASSWFSNLRRPLIYATWLGLAGVAFVSYANHRIVTHHEGKLHHDLATLPPRPVALVLGANAVTSNGAPNLHFVYRMDAAAALYHAGKVGHLLVSGDNHHVDYDEPEMMRRALIKRGVPFEAITCDYAGFRTLDSVVRARHVFAQEKIIVVTQRYHATRALEIARARGLDAIAFCSQDVARRHTIKTEAREVLARALTALDLYLWHRHPRFYGPIEPIDLTRATPIASPAESAKL